MVVYYLKSLGLNCIIMTCLGLGNNTLCNNHALPIMALITSSQGSLAQTLREVQPTFFYGIPRCHTVVFPSVILWSSTQNSLPSIASTLLPLHLSPSSLSFSLLPMFISLPLPLHSSVYEMLMKNLKEDGIGVRGFKRNTSSCAKNEEPEGNINRQNKWDNLSQPPDNTDTLISSHTAWMLLIMQKLPQCYIHCNFCAWLIFIR